MSGQVTSYTLEYADGSYANTSGATASWTSIRDITGTAESVQNLDFNAAHSFRIYGVNSIGDGATSSILTITTHPELPGSRAPTIGQVVGTAATLTTVDLSWTAASSGGLTISNHKIYKRELGNAFDGGTFTSSGNASYMMSDLSPGTTY